MHEFHKKGRRLPMAGEEASNTPSYSVSNPRRRFCHWLSIRNLLKIIAKTFISLMIGTFTVVIALQQHNLGKENRQKDLEIASELRQQEFRINEQRRGQELALDQARRLQDLSIADSNHRDSVLNVYVGDLSSLLLENNYSLSRPLLNSIIRPMTLTVLRQLDPSRKILLLKFLYESKMLNTNYEETRVDLSDADLNGIQFGKIRMQNLSLVGASLVNATFLRTDITSADFEGADLTNALFINATLSNVCFYRTRLIRVQFFRSDFYLTDLSLADLTRSSITLSQLQQSSSYNQAILPNGIEASSENLFHQGDKCSLKNWQIDPENTIDLASQCHFNALSDDITMAYQFHIHKYKRLIEREEALFQLYFKAFVKNPKDLRVDFIFFDDEDGKNLIDRRLSMIIARVLIKTESSFSSYFVSSSYPRNALFLRIEIFLNTDDTFTDFEFYVQHKDAFYYKTPRF